MEIRSDRRTIRSKRDGCVSGKFTSKSIYHPEQRSPLNLQTVTSTTIRITFFLAGSQARSERSHLVSQPYLSPRSRKQRSEVTFRHDQFSISNLMTAMSQPSWKNYPQPVAIQTLSTVRALRWVESSSVNGRTKAVRNCTPAADTLGAFRESDGIHIKNQEQHFPQAPGRRGSCSAFNSSG